MTIPEKLQQGDAVAIVATARKTTREELQPALKLLKKWGLIPVIGKSIGLKSHQFAGTDDDRATDFQHQLDDPKIKAIWCARGGYGTVRILDKLDFSRFKTNPKWIVGYSDVSALHAHVHKLGVASLHAQMPVQIDRKSPETTESLKRVLFGERTSCCFEKFPLNRNGKAKGELIGGNLSVLYSLCGSPSTLQTDGKILFLEDLDEYLYHIDRMMQNLKRNGWFENLAGLVIGGMSDMNDNTVPFGKTAEEIIAETVEEYDFPVAYNFPSGHLKDNRALVFGEIVELTVNEKEALLNFT